MDRGGLEQLALTGFAGAVAHQGWVYYLRQSVHHAASDLVVHQVQRALQPVLGGSELLGCFENVLILGGVVLLLDSSWLGWQFLRTAWQLVPRIGLVVLWLLGAFLGSLVWAIPVSVVKAGT